MRAPILVSTLILMFVAPSAGAQDLVQVCAGVRGPSESILACNRLIQTSPMDFYYRASLFYNRGLSRAQLGDLDGAIADFTRALQDYPNFGDAYNSRGFSYALKGQYEAARSDLENALAIEPNNSTARETLRRITAIQNENEQHYTSSNSNLDLIDEWETRSFSKGFRYRFARDGTFEYTVFQVGTMSPIEVTTGTYTVQGDLITLKEQSGISRTYRWSIGNDPIVADSRVKVLSLSGPHGEEQFYGSYR
jgi:tetratricopeptide (TPR) repeat protein